MSHYTGPNDETVVYLGNKKKTARGPVTTVAVKRTKSGPDHLKQYDVDDVPDVRFVSATISSSIRTAREAKG